MNKLFNKHNCKDELKEIRLKITPARVEVMKFLENTNEPVDVNSIIQYLIRENVNADPATIFRIVNLFVEKGIVQRIELGEGKYRYEKSKIHHHHLICINCKKVEDVEGEYISNLEKEIKSKKGFIVKSHSLEFFGICSKCQN